MTITRGEGGRDAYNALTRASNFLLFLQLIRICVLFFTDCVRTERGPWENSSSSAANSSSAVISDFGFALKMVSFKIQVSHLIVYRVDKWHRYGMDP